MKGRGIEMSVAGKEGERIWGRKRRVRINGKGRRKD